MKPYMGTSIKPDQKKYSALSIWRKFCAIAKRINQDPWQDLRQKMQEQHSAEIREMKRILIESVMVELDATIDKKLQQMLKEHESKRIPATSQSLRREG